MAEGHCEGAREALTECVGEGLRVPQGEGVGEREGLLDSVTESVALAQPLAVPEGVAAGVPEKTEPEGEAVAAKLPLRECVTLEEALCDGDGEVAADALAAGEGVRVTVGETLKEVVALGETRGVGLGLMLAVRPHVENIVTVRVVLPVGGMLWLLLCVRVRALLAVLQIEAETDSEGVLLADTELHLDTEPEGERVSVMLPVVQGV